MKSLHTTEISVSYLSWINDELRKQVVLLESENDRESLTLRIKTYLVAGVSGVALAVLQLLAL